MGVAFSPFCGILSTGCLDSFSDMNMFFQRPLRPLLPRKRISQRFGIEDELPIRDLFVYAKGS